MNTTVLSKKVCYCVLTALTIISFFAFTRRHQQPQARRVIVRSDDTISYLAFRYYGFFNDSLISVISQANRHINDFNALKKNDTLYFPIRKSKEPEFEELRSQATHAVLTYYKGDVRYLRASNGDRFEPVRPNLILNAGDRIKTGKESRAELVLDNRSVLRLDAYSQLTITALARSPSSNKNQSRYQGKFDLSFGSVWTRITKIFDRKPDVEVQFPTAVAGVQGTVYRAKVAEDSLTTVRVYQGIVEVRSKSDSTAGAQPRQRLGPPQQVPGPREVSLDAWIRIVRALQEIEIQKDGRPTDPRPFRDQGRDLEWVRWNQQRDRDLSAEI